MEVLGWYLPGHRLLSGQESAALAQSLRVGAEGVTSPVDALSHEHRQGNHGAQDTVCKLEWA